jgi:4-aminobutyrate aminotransferase-like enzyme/Ser/Thr protein kinase RdoA (MazF antagonist)/SAM-dependent methyltransferase
VTDLPAAGDVLDTPAPVLSPDRVTALVGAVWGLPAETVRSLTSERDANVLVAGRYVLKVSNPAEDPAVVDMENTAMAHAARIDPGLPLPSVVRTDSGLSVVGIADDAGEACLARLLTVVPGSPAEGGPVTTGLAGQVGALAARTSLALQGLFHRAGDRVLDWDIRRAHQVLGGPGVLDGLGDLGPVIAGLRPRLARAADATAALPAGLNHADVTLTNILTDDSSRITGLIDFGDMHHTAHVCDLAVALTSILRNTAGPQPAGTWELAGAVLTGYQRHRPLTPAEADVLGDLVLGRLALTLAISQRRAAAYADNQAYISQYDTSTRRVLGELLDLGPDQVARRLHTMAGTRLAISPGPRGPGADADDLLRRRRLVTGGPLSPLFYSRPLHIVRGEGPWLFAADGTRYLDGYNNVAVVGHAHPAVAQAVSRQLFVLNTHSRYLHDGIVELAERLLATMPEPLDTCLFTTSGTEANELAWRMATAYTGGNAAIIAEHAYHGSTRWMADLSSNEWPAGYRPSHVGTFAAPRSNAGGIDHKAGAERVAMAAAGLADHGDRAALVLADLGFTSEGILDAPADFVAGLVDGARGAGALFLADEVQAGYGRVGPALWRFAAFGITPDFVALGKPMGAGYPIGALVTRREIADSLARDYEYFSTFAGTPAAAAAGIAVLDVLANERIPERTPAVGDHLRARLRDLARQDARLGDVRGTGLIAGLEITGPPGAQDPASRRAFARSLLDAIRDRHVLAGLTGPDGTVLKVRPPLIWDTGHADLFAAAVADALAATRLPAGARMVPAMDAKTEELRAAHDVLAEFYVDRLAGTLDGMPAERAVLGLFCESVLAADLGTGVGDVGCGTGRLEPYLAAQGLSPRGVDLSPEMIRVARRDYPGFGFDVADVRDLPFSDASLAGVVCWYSLMFLAPADRPAAFGELARVVKPGGYLVTAFKAGDSTLRRAGHSTGLGVEFDIYWLAPRDMERQVTDAGFTTTFWGGRAAEGEEGSPQGYLIARRS